MKTMADLDRKLEAIVTHLWRGRKLPFPEILDNAGTTLENFGVEAFGIKVLVDPQSRLIPDDENTLAEKLNDTTEGGPKL